MQDILKDLFDADSQGISPPQNWTTRAAEEIRKLRVDARAVEEELAWSMNRCFDLERMWDSSERYRKRCIAEIKTVEEERDRLKSELAEARKALELVLPMAKGFLVGHDVGSNREYINIAETTLAGKEKEDESEQDYTDSDR